MTAQPESIDAYLASVSSEARDSLLALREQIQAAAPEAVESISYAMPAFKWRGKLLAAFAAFKAHYSYFPCCSTSLPNVPDAYRKHFSSKGTMKFLYGETVAQELVEWLVRTRMSEIEVGERPR